MLAASTLDVLDAQPMDRSDSWCKPTSVSTIISMRTSACDQALAQGSARRQSVRGLCDVQTRHGKSHLPRSTNLPGRCTRSIRGRSIYRFGRSIYQRSTIYPIYPIYPVDGRWFSPQGVSFKVPSDDESRSGLNRLLFMNSGLNSEVLNLFYSIQNGLETILFYSIQKRRRELFRSCSNRRLGPMSKR